MTTNDAGECCPDCKEATEKGREELLKEAEALTADNAFAQLGEFLKTPAGQKKLDELTANKKQPPIGIFRAKDHHFMLEHDGKQGEIVILRTPPASHLFRCEKIVAVDTHNPAGHGTTVRAIRVDGVLQRTASEDATKPTPTHFFSNSALGCGFKLTVLQPNKVIEVEVEFLADCKWTAALFGKAAV